MVVLGKLHEDDKAQYGYILQTNTERRWGITTDILWQLPFKKKTHTQKEKTYFRKCNTHIVNNFYHIDVEITT